MDFFKSAQEAVAGVTGGTAEGTEQTTDTQNPTQAEGLKEQAVGYMQQADQALEGLKGQMGGKFDGAIATADGYLEKAEAALGVPADATAAAPAADATAVAAPAAPEVAVDPAAAPAAVPATEAAPAPAAEEAAPAAAPALPSA